MLHAAARYFIFICFLMSSVLSVPTTPVLEEIKVSTALPKLTTVVIEKTTAKATTTTTTTTTKPPPTKPPLQAENQELKKPTSGTSTTTMRPTSTEQPLYRLNASNGQACILLQVDAVVTIKYRNKMGEDLNANIYVPPDATVTGNCEGENFVTMSLKWTSFVLTWSFAKTPGGERWYVDKIELIYNSNDRHFQNNEQPNKTIRLSSTKYASMLFPTPVGKSYGCEDEREVELTDGKNQANVVLMGMKLQPFKFKNNAFDSEFSCNLLSARADRDETAPLAVGSTLAVAVLLTISGYAGYRYYKVKKVKYDTME